MLAYISAEGIKLFLHGANAPIWRALVTLDNSTALNAVAAALIESGRFDEAEAELKEIARLAKENGTQEREETFLSGARKRLEEKRGK